MPATALAQRLVPLAAALALGITLAGCQSLGTGFVTTHVSGYQISDDALAQIRPGQSQALVDVVLGSPQTTNTFGDETAYYYVETRQTQTAFGVSSIDERRVLAIYFDKNKRVKDKALYGLKDGRTIAIESRRTPSYGSDKTFIDSLLGSVGL
jgi:outer membrane protein assembly factor BamE (lipoprotein component of BamABCDE complex)